MSRSVLHLRDPGVGVGRTFPVGVRQGLALAPAVKAGEVLGRRRLDPALLRHPRQHRPVALAIVAPHDGAQRGVGLHRRAVDADPLALHQAALGDPLQDPVEHRLVRLVRQTRARARKPGMIGNLLDVRFRGGSDAQRRELFRPRRSSGSWRRPTAWRCCAANGLRSITRSSQPRSTATPRSSGSRSGKGFPSARRCGSWPAPTSASAT